MKINEHCNCVVDTCWRKGMCEFCIGSHGGNKASVTCSLSKEEYEKRKKRWESTHDEPVYPTDTVLGIMSNQTQIVSRQAVELLRDCQKRIKSNNHAVTQIDEDCCGIEQMKTLVEQLRQLESMLTLVLEQAKAAVYMGETTAKLASENLEFSCKKQG